MNINKLFILIGLFFFLGLGSCSKKNNETPCSVSWAADLQGKVNIISSAAQAYATNPNSTTCNAYKNACQTYLNALQPYGDCTNLTGQEKSDWEAAMSAAEASLAAISC